MNYEDRLAQHETRLKNAIEVANQKIAETKNQGDEKAVFEWENFLHVCEYELENLEASFTMSTIWNINHVTYYGEVKGVREPVLKILGIDEDSAHLYRHHYSINNIEEYRQRLIELSGIKVKVPTHGEFIKMCEEIRSSNLSNEQKRKELIKLSCLTGFSESGYKQNPYGVNIANHQGMTFAAKDCGALEVFYENGLEKGFSI